MKDRSGRAIPNPGSDQAIRAGCICAVLDNNHGKWAARPPDDWWITSGCPIHWDQYQDTKRGLGDVHGTH